MLNWLWAFIMIISIIGGLATGKLEPVNQALLGGGSTAVTLIITIAGAICFWSGMLRVAERAGATKKLARLFSPLLRLLFPGLPPDGAAAQAILMNISANFLGLGNAATPFGLKAMDELQAVNNNRQAASRHMITFVVLNTASIQVIPTTVAALRLKHGSISPMSILPAVWLTSLGAAIVALLCVRIPYIVNVINKNDYNAIISKSR